jgi:glycosyltransferase involved in cell wall biosynthesis
LNHVADISSERSSDAQGAGRHLRMLMVAPTAVPGGMEEILFNLAVCLPDTGISVDVISLQDGPLVDRLREHAVEVEVMEAGRLRQPHRFAQTVRALGKAVATRSYDAVFSDMPKAHLYAGLPAKRHGVASLWCQAGVPDPPHWIDRAASALPATGIVALSRDAAQAQQRLNARRRVHMLHPGIDLTRFVVRSEPELRARCGIGKDAVLISLVGRLQPWKGQPEFLRAAALLAAEHPEAHFAIVGGAILGWEGDYPEQLERLAVELGLRDRVTFTGHTTDVPGWMAASDIVVNASHPEPFGLVVVEAMAAGCATVAVAAGGPRDIIHDGESGVLCERRDAARLAQGIRRVLDDYELRAKIGFEGRLQVEQRFSRQLMAAGFAEIVEDSVRIAHRR